MAEAFNKGYDEKDRQLKLSTSLKGRKFRLDLLEAEGRDVRAGRLKLLQDELSLLDKGSDEYKCKIN
jgi:hypothetical protein